MSKNRGWVDWSFFLQKGEDFELMRKNKGVRLLIQLQRDEDFFSGEYFFNRTFTKSGLDTLWSFLLFLAS